GSASTWRASSERNPGKRDAVHARGPLAPHSFPRGSRVRITLVSSAAALTAAAVLLAPAVARAASGLDPVRVKGSKSTGALSRAHVPVTLALAPRDTAGLAKAAAKGGGLTPAQFNARYAPSVKAVRAWAKAHSLKVKSVSANHLLVVLDGS